MRSMIVGVAGALLGCAVAAAQPEPKPQPQPEPQDDSDIAHFTVRAGYEVTVAVVNLPGTRFLEVDDKGNLYVSRPDRGDIVRLKDADGDGVYETITTFIKDKPSAHGMCFKDGWLWFTTTGAVHKARDTTGGGVADEVVDVIPVGQLPRKGAHWWRSLLVTDDSLYTSIGDGDNISDQTETERQKIWRFDLDGSNKRLFCSGLRNTEKLRLRPGGGADEIWGCDHGSDWFGAPVGDTEGNQPITDLNPPDELNKYVQDGAYGHPFIVGNRLPRYEYLYGPGKRDDIHDLAARSTPPEWCIPAHWAVNGFTFIDPKINATTGALPPDHSGDIFIAAHGSWNSSQRVGYCVARILMDDGKPYGLLKIVQTLQNEPEAVRARPVDCVQAPDGSVLFSSDVPTGKVFRIRYTGKKG